MSIFEFWFLTITFGLNFYLACFLLYCVFVHKEKEVAKGYIVENSDNLTDWTFYEKVSNFRHARLCGFYAPIFKNFRIIDEESNKVIYKAIFDGIYIKEYDALGIIFNCKRWNRLTQYIQVRNDGVIIIITSRLIHKYKIDWKKVGF